MNSTDNQELERNSSTKSNPKMERDKNSGNSGQAGQKGQKEQPRQNNTKRSSTKGKKRGKRKKKILHVNIDYEEKLEELEELYNLFMEWYSTSYARIGNRIIKNMWRTNKKMLLVYIGIIYLVAIYLSGLFWETIYIIRGYSSKYSLYWILYYGSHKFIFPTLEFLVAALIGYYKIVKELYISGRIKEKPRRKKRKKKNGTEEALKEATGDISENREDNTRGNQDSKETASENNPDNGTAKDRILKNLKDIKNLNPDILKSKLSTIKDKAKSSVVNKNSKNNKNDKESNTTGEKGITNGRGKEAAERAKNIFSNVRGIYDRRRK